MVKNAIKVYARLKPERSRKRVTTHEVYHRPKEHVNEDFLVLTAPPRISNEYIDNRPESWNFSFFKIYEESIEQAIVFDEVAKPVIHSVLDGYNGTIFAYGQTGSGKTFSITGDQKNYGLRGILPRTLQYLFDIVKKHPENLYSMEVSYLEIYNENGYDLLNRKQEWTIATKLEDLPRVTIQEDEAGTLHLKNLSFWSVSNEKDALDLLFVGDTNRVVSETPMNLSSSRSHCIFTIIVSVKKFGADRYSRAKMHLVDLAGSERVYKYAITGTILTEAKHINLSLHYLEQVIVCLGQENTTHIPYRNSLLTAILRDSLGGNCLTTMLATLSLSIGNLEETISTCRFAQRVALVRNDVSLILEKDVSSENALLKMENERLRQQIEMLTKQYVCQSARELSQEEKFSLDTSVKRFLESDGNLICDKDPRKLEYCLESLKKSVKLKKLQNLNEVSSSENLGYYKNLVLQRDKEISLLIDMLKKEREKSSKEEQKKDDQEKNNEANKNDFPQILMSTFSNVHSQKESKNESKVPVSAVQHENNISINRASKEKKNILKNKEMSLTPEDVSQLRNLISMYEGSMLTYNQLPTVERNLGKEKTLDNIPSGDLSNGKQAQMLKNFESQKLLKENKTNEICSNSLKEVNTENILPNSESNSSLSKTTENNSGFRTKTEIRFPTAYINKNKSKDFFGRIQSVKTDPLKEDPHREIVTLNLFEIVKDDLRDDTISEPKSGNSKKHKSKQSSSREKHQSKTSSERNLLLDSVDSDLPEKHSGRSDKNISPKFGRKPVEKPEVESQKLVENIHSSIHTDVSIINSSHNGSFKKDINKPQKEMASFRGNPCKERISKMDQGAVNFENIMSTSKDFIIPGNSRKHLGNVTDRSLGSSVNLQSSRSMSSVKSEAYEYASRTPTLSRTAICINNEEKIRSSNTASKSNSTEFLHSTQRERNSTADLMHRFQVDIDSSMTLNSLSSPKHGETTFRITPDNESARFIKKSEKELEKRLLSKDEDDFDEELSRMEKHLPSSLRNSDRVQDYRKSKEDEDFEKSLPLTGDPDIDEEIIAFYKAKRTGGTY
ncbi:kinesin-like protein KIF3A [Belonocnema kinseyi]|uniref:kinesin-like protein KIF3A n=1 Tax=Belonocnema kinseyi TaxID=2817044 RepID=UPI00143CE5BC|nr:kinesin-like protein KIF3A [Belonocnema kinseyi]